MATSDAPLSVQNVALTVNDLQKTGDFYQSVIGLDRLSSDGEAMVLGKDGLPLVELRRDAKARPRPQEAGLFHTAFLLPDRTALGRWLRFAAEAGLRLDGASDHLVSEALYLRDPEGNGIEIYVDRPRAMWTKNGDQIVMDTLPLDIQALLRLADQPWSGAPTGTVVGHVHLQVGDIPTVEGFMSEKLGMQRVAHIPSASFFSTGGYHHHLAGNIWNSRGAGRRSPDAAGLAEVVLAADQTAANFAGTEVEDPWGNRFRMIAKPAA